MMHMDLYIYYRVATGHAKLLEEKVTAMQAGLRRQHGVAVALKRRPEESKGQYTYMEVYLAVPGDFDAALERAVSQAGLAALIDGPRHVETFLDIAPCA
jgi:hypothetical protein